jgi:hypothetical protein
MFDHAAQYSCDKVLPWMTRVGMPHSDVLMNAMSQAVRLMSMAVTRNLRRMSGGQASASDRIIAPAPQAGSQTVMGLSAGRDSMSPTVNSVGQSNLTFSAGTAVAWYFDSSGGSYGLAMGDSATVSFNGTATAPCYLAKYSMVQEGVNGNWTSSSYIGGITGQSYTHAPPGMSAQFTKISVPASEAGFFRDDGSGDIFIMAANNCEMYAGGGGYFSSINSTNCLWVNAATGLWDNYGGANITFQGCTFFRGSINAHSGGNTPWPITIFNCAFDSTIFTISPDGGATNGYYTDYNSFMPYTSSNTTPYFGGHEITNIVSYNWETSWFGNYYLPTNSPLIQAGSTTANLLGLYHFTTQTNQVPETNAVVDIGYHYVATDAYGNPLDTNGDGIPDYLEDTNGNGLVDSGEIGWNIIGDLGLQVIISKPRNGSTIP